MESEKIDQGGCPGCREEVMIYVIGVDGVVGLHYSDICDTYGFRDTISTCK